MCDKPYDEATVIKTGKGDALFYDTFSGRYFRSSVESIRTAENEMNRAAACGEFVSLNTFYDTLGLDSIKFGDDFGWGGILNGNDCKVPCLDISITYEAREIDGEQTAVGILDYKTDVDMDSFGHYSRNWLR